jgi:hydrogenase/urease accessory protein HupE
MKNSISLFVLLFLLLAVPAFAHDITVGASKWCFGKSGIIATIDLNSALIAEIKGGASGPYNLGAGSDRELQQAAAEVIQPYIDKRLSITVNDKVYPVKVTRLVRGESGLYTIWLAVENIGFNRELNPVKIDYRLLFAETNNSHMNMAYAYLADATPETVQKILDSSQPASGVALEADAHSWELSIKGAAAEPAPVMKAGTAGLQEESQTIAAVLPLAHKKPEAATNSVAPLQVEKKGAAGPSPTGGLTDRSPQPASGRQLVSTGVPQKSTWANIYRFLLLGIEHILTGYDHIAFLLALIVIGLSVREVLKVITAFTVAHSITLLLAALQILSLNSRFVESAIALSICYVALENLFRKKVDYRWLVTFGFGLIHGFGFASALQELIVGKSNLLVSVLSFNLGVEAGQLMIFFVLLPILYQLRKREGFRMVTTATSAAIFLLGFTWLVERVFDLKVLPI